MSAPTTSTTLAFRPAASSDRDFLRQLFASARASDFAVFPGTPEQVGALIDLQFTAQASQLSAQYPEASHEIIVCDGVDVGRIITIAQSAATRLVDICIGTAWQNRGIGTQVLTELIQHSDQGLPIDLSVWAANTRAVALYQRLGFEAAAESTGYVSMRRSPRHSAGVAA